MFDQHKERAAFFVVYIREAHASDGWVSRANERQGISIPEPTTHDARAALARETCSKLKIRLPCLVDGMDDRVNKAYGGWPDRLCVIDIDGRIAVIGGPGPRGFMPSVAEARQWLERFAAGKRADGGQQQP